MEILYLKNLVIASVIYLISLCLYLSLIKKYKNKKELISNIFSFVFGAIGIISLYDGYIIYGDKVYSNIFVIAFMTGILLDKKGNIITMIIILIGMILQPDIYDLWFTIKIDIAAIIVINLIGYYAGHILHKKCWPSIISAPIYAVVMTSTYMIIYLCVLVFDSSTEVFYIFNSAYVIKVITYISFMLIIFTIINVFYKRIEDEEEKNNIINIFLKKFDIAIIVLYSAMFIFMFIFNYEYVESRNSNMLHKYMESLKYDGANLKVDNDSEEEFKKYYNDWIWEDRGVICIIEKNYHMKNKIDEKYLEKVRIKKISDNIFNNIDKYPESETIIIKDNTNTYYAEYFSIKNYYVVALVTKSLIMDEAMVASIISTYTIVVVLVSVFFLILYLLKTSFVNRIINTNNKLNLITNGDYDVVFDDESSTEFSMLSKHINKTVVALKNNIEEIKQKNIEELKLAKKIQESQLKANNMEYIAFDIHAKNIPAEEVGGDFYDYFYLDYRRILFLIADVSGKGIPGAMFMIKAKNTIANYAKQTMSLESIAELTNKSLSQNNDAFMFVTCFMAELDLKIGVLKYITAAHNPPILIANKNGKKEVEYLKCNPKKMFGINENSKYEVESLQLNEGDKIVLYTDGVTESRNKKGEFYGEKKFLDFVKNNADNTVKKINENIIDSLIEFSSGAKQFDDITLLTLEYKCKHNEIKLKTTDNDFVKGKEFLNKFIKLYNMDTKMDSNLKVVYDEIFSNIRNYAYGEEVGEVIFKINLVERNKMEMIFMDKGVEFDPINCKSKKFEVKAEDKIDGGMGIMFCKNIMDEMKYERKDGYNILSMYKKFDAN